MKTLNICICLLICTFSLYGGEYEKALKYYKDADYKTSYKLLSKLYLKNLSNSELNFYLGKVAYKLGKYTIALAAFERVEILDEDNPNNLLRMGETYAALKMQAEAEESFKRVIGNKSASDTLVQKAQHYLGMPTKSKRSLTRAYVSLGLMYDSNVNYGTLQDNYTTASGTQSGVDEISDIALQAFVNVENIYKFDTTSGLKLKNSLSGFLQEYQIQKEYSTRFISYTPSLAYTYKKSIFEFLLGGDDLFVAKDEYLRTLYVQPSYGYLHTSKIRSFIYYRYQQKMFQRSFDKNLGADHNEISYALQTVLSQKSLLVAGMVGINEKKRGGSRVDVDYDEYRFNVKYVYQIMPRLDMDVFGEYKMRNYADLNAAYNSTREDRGVNAMLNFNYALTSSMQVYFKSMYINLDSNQDEFTYEKYTMTLGLSKTF